MEIPRALAILWCLIATVANALAAEETTEIVKRGEREIVLTREFPASREVVFRALTRPERIRQWMRPDGMTLVECEVDLREGGSFRYLFRTSSGRALEVRGAYAAVEVPTGFRYTESYDFSPLTVSVTTTLIESGNGTIFEQVLVYDSQANRNADFDGVATSAESVYAILERHLLEACPNFHQTNEATAAGTPNTSGRNGSSCVTR